ncbi:hypothetical protein, variant 5 [Aphanomyces invadans]|uniref:Uncharacterized protein n=2 Tax=Aphanomyces invadans TaxID=157072 RepID=A0A024TT96_9STRA|nr:hypothetical protein, variant 4 [Aphanomyces invadans]XP_008873949.1 hypothetical protein, variant 5 [Aphanomyces invadans]ETV97239.1 hypothetical protein, variant 4 [Aphanomyces invadans]ETV97240.1 hypothetical protein, variant 5 [Aphanomyces invadans]|eukprot:XP_008873945.1 hypothetical protein, variant 4 [Aphanomyces invadans]
MEKSVGCMNMGMSANTARHGPVSNLLRRPQYASNPAWTMPTATHAVLSSTDLFQHITPFQQGVPHHMLELTAFPLPISSTVPVADIAAIVALVQAWWNAHGRRQCRQVWTYSPRASRLVLVYAAATGQGHLLRTCFSSKCTNNVADNLMDVAAFTGQLRMVAELVPYIHDVDEAMATAMLTAASNGHVDIVEFFHRHMGTDTHPDTTKLMDAAASNGHLAVVQFLHFHRREGCTSSAMDLAASHGHLDILAFLHAHRSEGCTPAALSLAAANGHVQVMQWLVEHRGSIKWRWSEAITNAAAHGHVQVLAYIHATKPRTGWTKHAMDVAASNGHVQVVEFLHRERKEGCSEAAEALATAFGHDEVVAYFQKYGDEVIRRLCCACGFNKPRVHDCPTAHRASFTAVCVK